MIIKYKQRVIFQEFLNWHKIIQSQANSIYQVVCGQSILQRESVEMCWSNDTADQFLFSKSLNTVSTIISVSTTDHWKMSSNESTEPETVSNIETRSLWWNIAGGTFVADWVVIISCVYKWCCQWRNVSWLRNWYFDVIRYLLKSRASRCEDEYFNLNWCSQQRESISMKIWRVSREADILMLHSVFKR